MQLNIDLLNTYHETGKLRHAKHPSRDLHVWTYSQATVYGREWDDLTLMSRGLVTDSEGVVLSRPFRKFFNWGEPLAPGPEVTSQPFWAYDKEDGTLIVVSLDANGDRIVNTKGSFTTWHTEATESLLGDWKPYPGMTAVFEFIHPQNRIVLDYGEYEGVILLGAVDIEDGTDHYAPADYAGASGWEGRIATPRSFNLHSMLQTVANPENGPNREGFVVVWPTNDGPSPRVKLKFAQYVQLHATLSRLNNVAVWEALSTGTFDALLDIVPDEIYDKVRECADELNQAHEILSNGCKYDAQLAMGVSTVRKEQAAWVLRHCGNSSLVFAALDNKASYESMVWNQIKPALDTSWTFLK